MKLDKRQRAMLKEMGVTVWQPLADEPAAVGATGRSALRVNPGVALEGRPAARPYTPTPATPPKGAVVGAGHARDLGGPSRARPAPTNTPVARVESQPALPERPAGVERMDWGLLQSTVAGCQACVLCASRKNTVFGTGAAASDGQAPQVDWLVVGEAPGEQEDRQGLPFVGPAGLLLDNMLRAVGLDRGQATKAGSVYIANVLKCRPPSNRAPQPQEIAQCTPYLQRQIELLRPKIILALGRFAAQTLLAPSVPDVLHTPLGKLRGRAYEYQGTPVVVSYHPAYLLRNLPDKAKAWDDWCLALSVVS